ncbi:MAG: hypothetical protein ACPG1C_08725 [Alphaproteobacteria bacterium]
MKKLSDEDQQDWADFARFVYHNGVRQDFSLLGATKLVAQFKTPTGYMFVGEESLSVWWRSVPLGRMFGHLGDYGIFLFDDELNQLEHIEITFGRHYWQWAAKKDPARPTDEIVNKKYSMLEAVKQLSGNEISFYLKGGDEFRIRWLTDGPSKFPFNALNASRDLWHTREHFPTTQLRVYRPLIRRLPSLMDILEATKFHYLLMMLRII